MARSHHLELATGHVVRPSAPDDAPRLVAMFERCSPHSRYARFLAPVQHFPAAHLVDVVRPSRIRHSWVVDDLDTGQVVAVGSLFRNQVDSAEIGLLVEDAAERQGLGTALLDVITASACDAGITTLTATTLADSRHVLRMLRRIGPTRAARDGHLLTLSMSLACEVEALAS